MAPKRKTVTPQLSQQPTLSFHGKQSKVTKASAAQLSKSTKKDPALADEPVRIDLTAGADSKHDDSTPGEHASGQQVEAEASTPGEDPLQSNEPVKTEDVLGGRAEQSEAGAVGGKTLGWIADEQEQARKVPDSQIKRYWRVKEQERLAPRVHQDDLTVYEKVLREWDMSGQYGPCIGIARLKRWKRANMLGLKPPVEVLAVLLKDMDSGDAKAQRAHVDELMSSKLVET
ncbi:hypothetical protein LTR08_005417 [Meristemomyces frigidus]|nr:hypothetical protein LTR08_005417 [Meristemomyces frigidus]